MTFSGRDRRLRTRYRVRVPFTLKNGGQEEVQGITRNISFLGIAAYTNSLISQAQPVRCLLQLPSQPQPLVARGTVIRCETLEEPHPDGSHEVGVFFKGFEGTGESDLLRFLDRLQQEEKTAIQAGYRVLKQRLAARRRRKRLEMLRKKRKRLLRLRRKRKRLQQQKKAKAARRSKKRSR